MLEKESLSIILSEDLRLKVDFRCSLDTVATVMAYTLHSMKLPESIVPRLCNEIATRCITLGKGESK